MKNSSKNVSVYLKEKVKVSKLEDNRLWLKIDSAEEIARSQNNLSYSLLLNPGACYIAKEST